MKAVILMTASVFVVFMPKDTLFFAGDVRRDTRRLDVDGVVDEGDVLVVDHERNQVDRLLPPTKGEGIEGDQEDQAADEDEGDDRIDQFQRSVGGCSNQRKRT